MDINVIFNWLNSNSIYVTIFGKIDHLRASTEIHFLPIPEN